MNPASLVRQRKLARHADRAAAPPERLPYCCLTARAEPFWASRQIGTRGESGGGPYAEVLSERTDLPNLREMQRLFSIVKPRSP
jgi:hypothetical protein